MNIVILDDYEKILTHLKNHPQLMAQGSVEVFHEKLVGDALKTALLPAQIVILSRDRTPFKKELIDQLPNLQYVIFTGNRNGALDYQALAQRNIPVSFTEFGPSKDTTAELTWALILAAFKRIHEQSALMTQGLWRNEHSILPALKGARLGMLGLGNIGKKVATVGQAFGMEVVTWSPNMTQERAAENNAQFVSIDELLETSDIVSLHLVVGEATKNLLDANRLAKMRPNSLLVNTSRSSLIVTKDLIAALRLGRPGMAALDVFDVEPLPKDSELHQLPNLLMTPHLGFVSQPVFEQFSKGIHEVLFTWIEGRGILNQVTL